MLHKHNYEFNALTESNIIEIIIAYTCSSLKTCLLK